MMLIIKKNWKQEKYQEKEIDQLKVCISPKEYFQSLKKLMEIYEECILFSFISKKYVFHSYVSINTWAVCNQWL